MGDSVKSIRNFSRSIIIGYSDSSGSTHYSRHGLLAEKVRKFFDPPANEL